MNLIELKFVKMHPLLKHYNLFYSNGVAILSGFHDIPQNISVGFTDVINKVTVVGQLQGQGPKTRKGTTRDLRDHVCNMTVIGPVVFDICSGNEVCVKTSK